MSTSKEFKDFILEQLSLSNNITCKKMMGEFLLYYNKILFGGIYDNRLLIKKTPSNSQFLLKEELPYETAKPMYLVENLEDKEYLAKLVRTTCKDLKNNISKVNI